PRAIDWGPGPDGGDPCGSAVRGASGSSQRRPSARRRRRDGEQRTNGENRAFLASLAQVIKMQWLRSEHVFITLGDHDTECVVLLTLPRNDGSRFAQFGGRPKWGCWLGLCRIR